MSANTVLCDVPVVVMSGRQDDVGEHFARMPNVVDHITKPFAPDALLAVIGHTLQKRSEERAAAAVLGLHALARTQPAPEGPSGGTGGGALGGDVALIPLSDGVTLLRGRGHTGVASRCPAA